MRFAEASRNGPLVSRVESANHGLFDLQPAPGRCERCAISRAAPRYSPPGRERKRNRRTRDRQESMHVGENGIVMGTSGERKLLSPIPVRSQKCWLIRILVCKAPDQREQDDQQVERECPMADIIKVILNALLDRSIAPPTVHLSPAGNAHL